MLKSLVSPRSNNAPEHIEAVQAERDFFREKYAAQMNEMEDLKGKLKESQRVIDRLRRQVLELEMGKDAASAAAAVVVSGESANRDNINEETTKQIANGSSSTSLTSMIQEEDSIQSSSAADISKTVNEQSAASDVQHEEGEEEEKEDDDEADQIRANAERLLQWSDYQSRRSTLSPSNTPSNNDDKNRSFTYDTTNDTSSTRNDSSSEFTRINSNSSISNEQQHSPSPLKMEYSSIGSTSKQGKMTKFLNGLKDIIDPPLDDYDGTDSEEDRDESSDEESSFDHRSLDG
ncbi:hypothetical protein ACHAWO_003428 [Cyclotella atomus]|jgi:hypothetical protein|uniref:Uncharacterized protein n=1 Tax=Cyclotella atomus TaxID=382360 RepID=A0ABD3QE80_9STRA